MKRAILADDLNRARQEFAVLLAGMEQIALDGSRDAEDAHELDQALDGIRTATDAVVRISKRLQFLRELERLRSGSASASGRWHTVSLVCLGVDCGYAIEDVNRIVEATLGMVAKRLETSSGVSPPVGQRSDDRRV